MPRLTRYFILLLIALTGLQFGYGLWLLYLSQVPPSDLSSAGEAIVGVFLSFLGATGLLCSSLALSAKGTKDRRIEIITAVAMLALCVIIAPISLLIIPIAAWVLYRDRQVSGS